MAKHELLYDFKLSCNWKVLRVCPKSLSAKILELANSQNLTVNPMAAAF